MVQLSNGSDFGICLKPEQFLLDFEQKSVSEIRTKMTVQTYEKPNKTVLEPVLYAKYDNKQVWKRFFFDIFVPFVLKYVVFSNTNRFRTGLEPVSFASNVQKFSFERPKTERKDRS